MDKKKLYHRKYYLENTKNKRKKVKCDICNKSLLNVYLQKHINDIHNCGKEKITCDCGKTFYEDRLEKHLNTTLHKNRIFSKNDLHT